MLKLGSRRDVYLFLLFFAGLWPWTLWSQAIRPRITDQHGWCRLSAERHRSWWPHVCWECTRTAAVCWTYSGSCFLCGHVICTASAPWLPRHFNTPTTRGIHSHQPPQLEGLNLWQCMYFVVCCNHLSSGLCVYMYFCSLTGCFSCVCVHVHFKNRFFVFWDGLPCLCCSNWYVLKLVHFVMENVSQT